jgi:hypothetical protein
MYSAFARKLFEADTSQEAGDEINEFIGKLRAKRPSIDEFTVAFRDISYTNANSKQKNFVRYILRAVSEFYNYKYPCDMDDLTIEHLHPQSMIGNGWSDLSVGQVGNLIFLDQKFNEKLKTHKIEDKLARLKENNYVIPVELVGVTTWTPKQALARTELIAKVAYEEVWRF